MIQSSLPLVPSRSRPPFPEPDFTHADFGPFNHSYRRIHQLRPNGGFTYRFGRPSNAVTAGVYLSTGEQLPWLRG